MADDRDAQFEELYRYYPAVVSLLKRLGFDHEDARDLAQQVFVRVYEHMDTYRGESKSGYLLQTARRLAFDVIRDRHAAKREGIAVTTDVLLELSDERTPPADATVERKERIERVERAVLQLPENLRTPVRLQLSGASYEEMAPVLRISMPALKSRLHEARKRLRELLGEDEGLGGRDDQ